MDNNNTQMENWKKLIIMDPVLNSLFDSTVSAEDLLIKKILVLPHDQIVKTYTKLATIKHSLSKSLQKEVQIKYQLIERSFKTAIQYREEYDQRGDIKINQQINYLKKFNSKYQTVKNSLIYWRNICKILHFSKALETFRVNSNILHTLMRGYNRQQQAINSFKVSKIIKQLYFLSTHHDFTGMDFYETEKVFIGNTKNIVHEIAKKNVLNSLNENDENQLNSWIQVFVNLASIRDFITVYFKGLLVQLGEKMKQCLKQPTISQLDNALQNRLIPFLFKISLNLIMFEQAILRYRHMQNLQSVPNLFTKFWQKLTEYFYETLNWNRKQQNSRNHPKTYQHSIIWKYPVLFFHISTLCDLTHAHLLQSNLKNSYKFVTIKEKLIKNLVELGSEYHQRCLTRISQIVSQNQSKQLQQAIQNLCELLKSTKSSRIFKTVIKYTRKALIQKYEHADKENNQQLFFKSEIKKFLQKQQNFNLIQMQSEQLKYFYEKV